MRRIFYTADLITPDGTDTDVYGDGCEPGDGQTLESGWWNPDWSIWSVSDEHAYAQPDVFDAESGEDAVGWLVDRLSDRLGAIESDGADTTIYAADSYTHPYEGKSVRPAAHIEGFTREELDAAIERLK